MNANLKELIGLQVCVMQFFVLFEPPSKLLILDCKIVYDAAKLI